MMLRPSRWCQDSTNRLPPMLYSATDSSIAYVQYPTPFRNTFCLIPQVYIDIKSTIATLFCSRCPRTIFFVVTKIVINAFNRHFWVRLWSHICKEIFEGLKPLFTNSNTSSTIPLIFSIPRIKTTVPYATPTIVFWLSTHTVVCIQFPSYVGRFFLKTSTTSGVFSSQAMPTSNDHCSAFTYAFPHNLFVSIWRPTDDRQSQKFSTCDINKFTHAACSFVTSGVVRGVERLRRTALRFPIVLNSPKETRQAQHG